VVGLGLGRERHQAHQRILGHSCVHDEANALPAATDRSASDEVLDLVDQALHAGVFERECRDGPVEIALHHPHDTPGEVKHDARHPRRTELLRKILRHDASHDGPHDT